MESSTTDELQRRKTELFELMHVIETEVARDGGHVALGTVDYALGTVQVILSGACGSCSLTGGTLEDGIKRIITQRLDWVTSVDGAVEENSHITGRGGWVPRAH